MPERRLAVIDVKPGEAMESQSGLQMKAPRIFGAFEEPAGSKRWAAVLMHPTSNYMGHYLISPLARCGVCALGVNSRYVGSDVTLLMERVIQDLGAAVKFLKDRGYQRVMLIGNSGGGALAAFYQAQAENLTVTQTAAGDPIRLVPSDLPPADAIVLTAAHAGRSRLFAEWIDPALRDEQDSMAIDETLDVYDARNGPPFSSEFLQRFRTAQRERRERIEDWVKRRLSQLRTIPDGPRDEAFVVHRTQADPRLVDLTIDTNDRPPGSIWGPAKEVNQAANAMGRFTTLTSFLSQWSSLSQADGPTNLAATSVPVLLVEHTADASTFPSTRDAWLQAAGPRAVHHALVGGTHYLQDQPGLIDETVRRIDGFIQEHNG